MTPADHPMTATSHKALHQTGVLPAQFLKAMIARARSRRRSRSTPEQIQPASLDLRLGASAYRLRASFLPGRGNARGIAPCRHRHA